MLKSVAKMNSAPIKEQDQADVVGKEASVGQTRNGNRFPQDAILKASGEQSVEISAAKTKPKVDFSIEAILSSRSSATSKVVFSPPELFCSETKLNSISDQSDPQFSWVYCTRYRPPKLPRAKRELNLRSRYRNPRIPFSTTEVGALERKFLQSPYLGSNDVNELAAALNMSPKRVKIWFQNRRARERREREVQ